MSAFCLATMLMKISKLRIFRHDLPDKKGESCFASSGLQHIDLVERRTWTKLAVNLLYLLADGANSGNVLTSEGATVRALIIDDSKAMRSILGRMLRGLGFEVLEAANGREALKQLEGLGKVDVALVDWNMPEMNGFEFVRAVRAEHMYDGVLLMMVTTETEIENVVRALAAGANEYVMKPFTREVILEKLQLFGMAGS
jgi:two-component system chemotaxis response regulator CheY